MFKNDIDDLVNAILSDEKYVEDHEADLENVETVIDSMKVYVAAVCDTLLYSETRHKICRKGLMDTDTYQSEVMKLDGAQRTKHNALIANCRMLNRICDLYGVKHICPDTEERAVIANFALAAVAEVFMRGRKRSDEEIETAVSAIYPC